MILLVADQIETFPGEANMTRCFLHVVNLVAKTLICVFDIPATTKKTEELDEAEKVLRELAKNIEVEDLDQQIVLAADKVLVMT
jgi:hypothetical protein